MHTDSEIPIDNSIFFLQCSNGLCNTQMHTQPIGVWRNCYNAHWTISFCWIFCEFSFCFEVKELRCNRVNRSNKYGRLMDINYYSFFFVFFAFVSNFSYSVSVCIEVWFILFRFIQVDGMLTSKHSCVWVCERLWLRALWGFACVCVRVWLLCMYSCTLYRTQM